MGPQLLRSRLTLSWMCTMAFVLSGLLIAWMNRTSWSFPVIVTLIRPYASLGSVTATEVVQLLLRDPNRTVSIHVRLLNSVYSCDPLRATFPSPVIDCVMPAQFVPCRLHISVVVSP